jgi:hypothetical protein
MNINVGDDGTLKDPAKDGEVKNVIAQLPQPIVTLIYCLI